MDRFHKTLEIARYCGGTGALFIFAFALLSATSSWAYRLLMSIAEYFGVKSFLLFPAEICTLYFMVIVVMLCSYPAAYFYVLMLERFTENDSIIKKQSGIS